MFHIKTRACLKYSVNGCRNRGSDGYQRALASMVYKFFDKKTGSGISVNKPLAKELHKPVIKKSKRRKV